MKPVSRMVFDEMRKLGLIQFDKFKRNNQITSKQKKGKRKHYYVEDGVYEKYIKG